MPASPINPNRNKMRCIKFLRQTAVHDLNHRHQIQTEEKKIHQVVFGEIFTGKMSMDATQSFQAAACGTDMRKSGNDNFFMIADNDRFHLAGTGKQQSDLASDVGGKFRHLPGDFRRDNQMGINSPLAEAFQTFELASFQAAEISREITYTSFSCGL